MFTTYTPDGSAGGILTAIVGCQRHSVSPVREWWWERGCVRDSRRHLTAGAPPCPPPHRRRWRISALLSPPRPRARPQAEPDAAASVRTAAPPPRAGAARAAARCPPAAIRPHRHAIRAPHCGGVGP